LTKQSKLRTEIEEIVMKCVHCKDEMIVKAVKGVEVDICPDCGGTWLDSGELKELTGYDLTAGRVLTCLRCEKPMQTKMVRGVEIDICPECSSVWLDGGELIKLSGFDYKAGRVLNCPKCNEQLQTKMLRGVEVDVCPKCSCVFLDRGEMEKLSAIEPYMGEKTDIGQFLHDAYNLRVELAIKTYSTGRHDKGKAAEIAGISLEQFDHLLKN
jgi:Zn-finger nucleic acid-binding protein